jgi:SulP family sulfate permease
VLVVGDTINEIDGSGEEVIRHLVERLRESGITMVFSGLKLQVLRVMEHTSLQQMIGQENLFRTEEVALDSIYRRITDPSFDAAACPLRPIRPPAAVAK